MSEESREQILADFQSCTGLEDWEECIHILQQYEWNLMDAIRAVHERIGGGDDNEPAVPIQDTTNDNTPLEIRNTISNKRQSESNQVDDSSQPRIIKTVPDNQRTVTGIPSTTNIGSMLEWFFNIIYFNQIERITVFENETIYDLRLKIFEKLSVPPEKQQFLNWTSINYDDNTLIRDLHLPKENTIRLSTIDNEELARMSNHTTSNEVPLTLLCEDKSGNLIQHKLSLSPNTTVSDIKKKIELVAHIPIKEQIWQNFSGANDADELRFLSIKPSTLLTVRRRDMSANQELPINRHDSKTRTTTYDDRYDDDQMDTEHDNTSEPYDDDSSIIPQINSPYTVTAENESDREPLIPDGCSDDAVALENFGRVFHARYDSTGPILDIGPLDQAIQNSLYAPIYSRRPLAIYLHNDRSVCANVFCSQVLAADSIIEYLANNYVLWAWDVTFESNQQRLFETIRRCVGQPCVQRLSSMDNDSFPLLLIVVRSRGSLELVNMIEGKSTLNEVLPNLIQSHESFEQQRLRDVDEEILRETRENLKKQQEDEYEQSRQADLAKERARQEEHDANERLKQERLQQQQECKARLPDEPSEAERNTTRLKIRLPNDEGVLMRRFRITDTLQVLFDYLTTEGRMVGEYKLLTTYPKRDLATLNTTDTFEQLKLYPQEQLILESL